MEGFEYSVLKGFQPTLADPRCEMVCCEIHPKFVPAHSRPTDITKLLEPLGYGRIEGEPTDGPYRPVSYKG